MTVQPSAQALRAKTQSARIFDGRQSQALLFAHSRQPYHVPKRRQRDLIETKPPLERAHRRLPVEAVHQEPGRTRAQSLRDQQCTNCALGSWLYEKQNFPTEYVQALMGHADGEMTTYYQEGHEEKAIE